MTAPFAGGGHAPRPPARLVVALQSGRGAGRKLVSDRLVARHGFKLLRFTGPLHAMLQAGLGLSVERLQGDAKRGEPLPEAGGHTALRLLQTLGHDWGRRLVHPDIWCLRWEALLAGCGHDRVLADDVRHANEAQAVRRRGGVLWRVERPGAEDAAGARAAAAATPDSVLLNDGSVAELLRRVDAAVAGLLLPPPAPLAAESANGPPAGD